MFYEAKTDFEIKLLFLTAFLIGKCLHMTFTKAISFDLCIKSRVLKSQAETDTQLISDYLSGLN